ncbi:MAG TPA: hypothetical protein VMJ33_08075 [Gallionella sp.]|nr:hypothetical protein [Gallionella sp.]
MTALLVVRMVVRRKFKMLRIVFAHDLKQPGIRLPFTLQICKQLERRKRSCQQEYHRQGERNNQPTAV